MTDDLLTSDEVRAILRVERTALARYLVGPDRIPHLRLGNPRTGPLRIRRSALEEWIRRREEETGGPEDIRAVSAKEFAAEAFVDGLKCWKRTGPTTFCGRHPDHPVHHIKPDSLRFHTFEARPRERTR